MEAKGVKLALGASVYDPTDPMTKMFFNILATFAEFEADLIRMRTREGMAIARAKGKLRGKQPKLSDKQQHVSYAECMTPGAIQSVIWRKYFLYPVPPSIELSPGQAHVSQAALNAPASGAMIVTCPPKLPSL